MAVNEGSIQPFFSNDGGMAVSISVMTRPISNLVCGFMFLVESHQALAQETRTFVNLNFEDATTPLNPVTVAAASAIPGWTPYFYGRDTISYNSMSIGDQNLVLWGPGVGSMESKILNGSYSLELHIASFGFGNVGIGQTGQLPPGSNWLLFNGHPQTSLQVTFGGEVLSYTRLRTREGYDVFGADISVFSGQTAELRFNALGSPLNFPGGLIDDIRFSAIPEPTITSIAAAGIAIFGLNRFRKFQRSVR